MENNQVKSGLEGLQALIGRAGANRGSPSPVEKWEPEFCGYLDMRICCDGSWLYMGSPISRPALVRLFSSVLRKDEDGKTYLVTPNEKIGIYVEDAPFVAVEMNAHEDKGEQVLTFRTNVGDLVEAGRDNPLRFMIEKKNNGVKPYLLARGRLEALLARSVTHELISYGEETEINGVAMFCVRSRGTVFPIMAVDDLNYQVDT